MTKIDLQKPPNWFVEELAWMLMDMSSLSFERAKELSSQIIARWNFVHYKEVDEK